MNVLVLALEDDPDFSLLPLLPQAIAFIEKARRKGVVFVHCLAGRSRSVAVVAAYLMIAYNKRSDEALAIVKSSHKPSQPNSGFVQQVRHSHAGAVPGTVRGTRVSACHTARQAVPPAPV